MANAGSSIQGLRVLSKFSDVQDPVEVLKNLNLDIEDLDRIRNISADGPVEKSDIRTISGLTIDLEKEAIAIYNETLSYKNILSNLNDARRSINGNIKIDNSVISPSFKFKTIDYNDSNAIKTVDLSTSRTSAWSSFGNPEDSVFYGGDVILSGNTSTIELSSLEFIETPIAKRFESQIPTHKIRVTIDNEPYDLYAMKGIPLRFKAFFRSVTNSSLTNPNLAIYFNTLNDLRPSWIIRTDEQEVVYENSISSTGQSAISFVDSQSLERTIEFYYPADRITRIYLNGTKLSEIPNVVLPNLRRFYATGGDLTEMPNFADIYPLLSYLDLGGNDLTRSNDPDLRTFSPQVIQRLKTPTNTLRSLSLDGVYSNNCTADLSELVGLQFFYANSIQSNSRRMTGNSPKIGNSVITYDVRGNNFTSIDSSVYESTTIENLYIRGNSISSAIDATGTNLQNIVNFTSGLNSHPIVDLSGKTYLKIYSCDSQNFSVNNIGTDIFEGCGALEEIRIQNTNVTGSLPDFTDNTSLKIFQAFSTNWQDASDNYSIEVDTFGPTDGGCRSTLENFNLQSGNLRKPIHPDAFRAMPALTSLIVRSYKKGITGPYPLSINQCFNLKTLYLDQNFMTGPIPNFSGNSKLETIILSQNAFSGIVPIINLPDLSIFNINNNLFTELSGLSCPNLTQLNASFNRLIKFPVLSETPKLQTLLLNNNITPGATPTGIGYTSGELIKVTSIRRLEMANCYLNRGNIDQILKDLNENYNTNPRAGVSVNLTGTGNASPTPSDEIVAIINRLSRGGWTLGLNT